MARIGLVTYAMRAGGMETMLLGLAARLQSAGHDVTILTTDEPGEWFDRCAAQHTPAEFIAGRDSRLGPARHATRIARRLRDFDVVLPNHAAFAMASLAQLPASVRVAPVLHNDMDVIYRVGLANAACANAFVAVGPKVAQEARTRLPGRPVREIRNGVDLPPEGRARAWDGKGPLRLAYAGRLWHEQKGVLHLPGIVKGAIARGIDVTLDVLGDGPDRNELSTRLRDAGVAERVHLHGFVSPENARARFLSAHALLMPSAFEGLPMTLLEAMAAGCVPVATRLSGITDVVIDDGKSGFLAPFGNEGAFADALVTIASNPTRWTATSHAAHQAIVDGWSLEAMARGYLTLIDDLLADRLPLPRSRLLSPPFVPTPFVTAELFPDWFREGFRTVRDRAKSLRRKSS